MKLTNKMPDGRTTTLHPLLWCLRHRRPEGQNLSDVARHMGVVPQSLYKWMTKAEKDRHFALPVPRALQLAGYFGVHPSLFRPDQQWSNVTNPQPEKAPQ